MKKSWVLLLGLFLGIHSYSEQALANQTIQFAVRGSTCDNAARERNAGSCQSNSVIGISNCQCVCFGGYIADSNGDRCTKEVAGNSSLQIEGFVSPQSPPSPQVNEPVKTYSALDHYNENYDWERKTKRSADKNCPVSHTAGVTGCATTEQTVQWAVTGDQIGQQVGSVAVQTAGQIEAAKAMKDGSISASLEAQAKKAEQAAIAQSVQGALNTAMAVVQITRATKHAEGQIQFEDVEDNALESLEGDEGIGVDSVNRKIAMERADGKINAIESGSTADNIVRNFDVNKSAKLVTQIDAQDAETREKQTQARTKQVKQKRDEMAYQMENIAGAAATEQEFMGEKAQMGAIRSGIQAVVNATQAAFGFAASSEYKKAAESMKKHNKGVKFDHDFDPLASGDALTPRSNNMLEGLDTQSGAVGAISDPTQETGNFDDLGSGPGDDLGTEFADKGPEPSPLLPSNSDQGSVGGSGGALGSSGVDGTSAAVQGDDSDPQARYANLGENGKGYMSGATAGGTGGYRAGGAGRRGGGSNDGGFDLNGLLAKFLPGGKDDKPSGKNSILDYGRQPAYGGNSILGKKGNLFVRASETYQKKVKEGAVQF